MILYLLLATAQPAPAAGVNTSETGGVGSQPASSAELLDGVGACVANVHQHGKVDFDRFKADGWQSAGKTERPGRGPLPKMQQFYLGKGNVIGIITHTGISATCQAVGSVTDVSAAEADLHRGIGERFKAVAAADYKGDKEFKAMIAGVGGDLKKVMISDTNRFIIESKSKDGKQVVDVMVTPRVTD